MKILQKTLQLLKSPQLLHNCTCYLQNTKSITNRNISYLVSLNRTLINVHGKDSTKLLQGLVTNDLSLLETENDVLYTMLLNVQGRTEYDLMLYRNGGDNNFLVECDQQRADELITLMKRYKLRSKVKFDINNELKVYSLFGNGDLDLKVPSLSHLGLYKDPRIKQMGYRILANDTSTINEIVQSTLASKTSAEVYMKHRYHLGIAEGTSEVQNYIPLELNLTVLNGVSYSKGCYIGQELVARAHHTGVIRKRVMPLTFSSDTVQQGDKITNTKGKNIGKVIGYYGDLGIGLMRLKEALKENETFLVGDNIHVKVSRPEWWPNDISPV